MFNYWTYYCQNLTDSQEGSFTQIERLVDLGSTIGVLRFARNKDIRRDLKFVEAINHILGLIQAKQPTWFFCSHIKMEEKVLYKQRKVCLSLSFPVVAHLTYELKKFFR